MKEKKPFKYDKDVVKVFQKFYEALRKAGVTNIHIKKDKEAKQ
jgi:hypothetical protein